MLWAKNYKVDRILEETAKEIGASKHDVIELIDNVFLEIKKIMESGEKDNADSFKSIQIRGLGTFKVNKNKINRYKKVNETKRKNDLENASGIQE